MDSSGEQSFVGVQGTKNIRVSCQIREARKTTSWKSYGGFWLLKRIRSFYSVDWYDGKQEKSLENTISILLQIEKLTVFLKESKEYTAIRMVIDENQNINDSQVLPLSEPNHHDRFFRFNLWFSSFLVWVILKKNLLELMRLSWSNFPFISSVLSISW